MSAKYKSPSFLLPNELNTSANTANDTGINSLYSMYFPIGSFANLDNLTQTIRQGNLLTVSYWYYPTNAGGDGYMIGSGQASNGPFESRRSGSNIRMTWKNSSNASFVITTTNSSITLNNWMHICCIWDTTNSVSSDKMQIWINGVRNTTLTGSGTTATGSGFSSSLAATSTWINQFRPGTTSQRSNYIDELAFFNKALTSTEIAALYDGTGSNIRPSNLMATNLNPIAYYPLGEQAQNTGKLPQATANVWQFPNGVLQDYVMDFDGVNDYIVGTESVVTGNSPRTISCWIKTSTQHIGNLFSLGEWSAVSSFASRFAVSTRGQYGKEIRIYTNTPTIILTYNTNIDLYNDSWYNIVVTYDGTNTYKLYINGNPEDTQTDNTTLITESGFSIGSWYNNAPTQFFNGQMSNVVVWNSDQSANIANIYNNGSPQTTYTVTPQNWWKLNATSVYTPSAPNYTTALDFNRSTNDYISLSSSIALTNNKTVSYWMKGSVWGIIVGGAEGNFNYYTYVNSSTIQIRDNSGTSAWTGLSIDTTKWSHICIAGDGTDATLYINGKSQGSKVDRSPTVDSIGAYNNGNAGWDGQLSNMAIWNTTLTSSQVSTLFNFGTPETAISFSPQAWWKLDDQTAITDSSNNGNTGTNNGATDISSGVAVTPSWKIPSALPITTTPNYTTALDFVGGTTAGSGHSIDISSYTGLSNTSAFTVSIWFKGEDFSTDWIFSTSIAGDFGSNVIGLDLNNSGQLRPNILFNGTSANISNVDIDLNKWYHAAITYDGSTGIATMYVNTVAYAGTNNLGSTTPTFSNNLVIAALEFRVASPSLGYYFDGLLSNMAIFNTALPATGSNSIEALYNNGTPLVSMSSFSSLQAWWKLDNLATGIQDSSGNGYNGSNSGATQVTSDVLAPQPVNGVSTTLPSTALQQSDLQFDSPYSNYSLNFDGAGDYITISSIPSLEGATEMSISCWLKRNSTGHDRIFGWWGSASPYANQRRFGFAFDSSNELLFQTSPDGATMNFARSTATITDTAWHHVAVTYKANSPNGIVKFYIDGQQSATTGDASATIYNLSTDYMIAFLAPNDTSGREFYGNIDELSVFTNELTSAQILEIYNNGKPGDLDNFSGTAPISWWRLGENAYFVNNNITLPNSISGAPSGVSSGTATSMLSADAPGTYANGVGTNLDIVDRVGDAALSTANSQSYNMIPDDKTPYVPGYVGDQISNTYSMTFDGVDDYFDTSNIDLGINSTLSMWFKPDANPPTDYALIGEGSYGFKYLISRQGVGFYIWIGSGTAAGTDYINYGPTITSNIIDGAWNFLSLVKKGGTVVVYLKNSNGEFSVSNTSSAWATKSMEFDRIGTRSMASPTIFFKGQIDEVAGFSEALTADQIKFDLYEPSLPLSSNKTADIENNTNLPTPVAWYRMGD